MAVLEVDTDKTGLATHSSLRSLEHSVDSFFHSGQAQHHLAPAVDTKKVEALWQRSAPIAGVSSLDSLRLICRPSTPLDGLY